MIKSFGDKETEKIYHQIFSRKNDIDIRNARFEMKDELEQIKTLP